MFERAQLLADCAADPDDDGPRLVWADAVGGERGELVVVQCDLARGGLTAAEARTRRLREHELLSEHAIAWAGELATVADRWSFRRGFPETAILPYAALDGPRLRAAAPLLGTVALMYVANGVVDPVHLAALRGLRGLAIHNEYLGPGFLRIAPAIAALGLSAFSLDGVDAQYLPALLEILEASPIETLRLRNIRVTGQQLDRLLDAAPRLRALDIEIDHARAEMIAVLARRELRAVRFHLVSGDELAAISNTPLAVSLERFGFSLLGTRLGLPSLPKLTALAIEGNTATAAAAVIAAELPALRALRLSTMPQPSQVARLVARLGDRFELIDADQVSQFRASHPELLHHAAEAMLTLGPPWFRTAPPFVLLRLDEHDLRELPAMPVDRPIVLGRVSSNEVVLQVATVGRRHATIEWCGDHHEIVDMGATHGVVLNGQRIERRSVLRDGDSFALGDARFRYFVGIGARERADAHK